MSLRIVRAFLTEVDVATFKAGDRARFIGGTSSVAVLKSGNKLTIGEQGTIRGGLSFERTWNTAEPHWGYAVEFDKTRGSRGRGLFFVEPHMLAPLTDPLAEQFLATVKSWGPLEKEHA